MFKPKQSLTYCLLFFGMLLSFSIQANITLLDEQQKIQVNDDLQVYTLDEELNIDVFRARQARLSYRQYQTPNFGFQANSVWMHSRIVNKSEIANWVVQISFTQLPRVEAYLFAGNELVYFGTSGVLNTTGVHRLPTFDLVLDKDVSYSLYIRIKSDRAAVIAPTFLMSGSAHMQALVVDSMIWGSFYGGLFILAFYAIGIAITKRDGIALALFIQVLSVAAWQIIWTGHIQRLPIILETFPIINNLAFLLPFVSGSLSLFIYIFFKSKLANTKKIQLMHGTFIGLAVTIFVGPLYVFSAETYTIFIRVMSFICLGVNLYIAIYFTKNRFKPAYPVLIGLILLAVGAVFSSLFVAGILPASTVNSYIFQISLIVVTCAFAFALNVKLRYRLEIEVSQASKDSENNFLLIEEQNVHLDMARRDALKASDVKSQFLANMSHEIRTPLNAIVGFSKELQDHANHSEREEHIRIINSSAAELLVIVNDILDFSKMEAGKLNINKKPFSAYDMLEDIAGEMARAAHLKQLHFIFDVQPTPSSLLGDHFKLKQLIKNLISNALKFTNYGSVTLRVRYSQLSQSTVNLKIDIIDTGIGISAVDKAKLFKPFNQLDDELNRSFQGTGLGLVICQELTFLMNGTIEVDSSSTLGSKFSVTIPFSILNSHLIPEKMTFWEQKTACLYDPNPQTRRTTCKLLQSVGIKTSTFESLDMLLQQKTEFDIAFITLQLDLTGQRTFTINRSSVLNVSRFVFLYSGPAPEAHQVALKKHQPVLLRLPLTTKKLEDVYAANNEQMLTNISSEFSDLPPIKVLAVDDMMINLKLLQTWLNASPITLHTASSGEKAILMCRETEYDLILMDIQMPHMDGMQTTGHIRKIPLNQGTPIVAITAHAFQEEKQYFLSSGMDDYLPKPIDIAKLATLIKEWCPHTNSPDAKESSVDWALCLKRSNNNIQAAFEYLDEFVALLPDEIKIIEELWHQQNIKELGAHIHKIHGATCYTGLKTLQAQCSKVETLLKRNQLKNIAAPMSELLLEAETVIRDWMAMRDGLNPFHSK